MISIGGTHKKIQKGNIKEFENLFRKLYEPLCKFAYQFVKDMDTAEEIVQDLFYRYWRDREKIKVNTSLKSYLYQATRNNCLKLIEHNKVKNNYSTEIKSMYKANEAITADSIETSELAGVIEKTLNSLPQRCREIFELSRVEGLKYQEIARKLSISIKTVEANMGKALKHFRANLKHYDELTC